MPSVISPITSVPGWTIVPIHYSHDPEKNEVWSARERESYPNPIQWNRMNELDFSARGGIAGHPAFRLPIHVMPTFYSPSSPLCVCCDFNVGIMAWPVCQIVRGEPVVIGEVALSPASVPDMVRELRTRWPAHPSDVWFYGDASGRAESAHDKQSCYDLIQIHMRGYAGDVVFKVPLANPPQNERLAVVDYMLKDVDGRARLVVDPSAENLLLDFKVVIRNPRGAGYLKSNNPEDSYSMRGHALEALGYFLCWEWPMATLKKVAEQQNAVPKRKRIPPRPREVWVPGSV